MSETVTPKRKKKKNIAKKVVSFIVIFGLICIICGLTLLFILLKDKPTLDTNDFISEQSTQIFDRNNNLIGEVGNVKRENISYEDLPNVLVDAFVAVEDSRFFGHNGFDVPRFSQAIIENLKTLSFSQGGSTFTMQLVKNTYFSDDEAGKGAVKSVERKVQEISLALELEREINKQTILELYLNKINFGGSGNIRGIQKAANYYFDKDVTELNLNESALLAGIINRPNAYNPHKNLELSTNRRNTVLYLMNYHGYITDEEYEMALAVKVEDLLVNPNYKGQAGDGNPYQAFIDRVISETIELTGQDPVSTPMKIYTTMDMEVQKLMDNIQAGNTDGYIEFPDDTFEVASICLNNKTGEIVGILGGRNYSYGGELLLNHATSQHNQPGSSIKPMLEYALAFEHLGWATSHVLVDKPLMWAGTDVIVTNSTNTYTGEITLKDAVGNSLNTPAIQTLQAVIDKIGNASVVEYLNMLGFNVTVDDFNLQYAIGGSTFAASCLELASAQSAMLNGGVRVIPHTIKRIEFLNGKDPIEPTYDQIQVLSEESAFLVSELLYSNVHGGYANLMGMLQDEYATYAKTGTTDWGSAGQTYGIPIGAAKDGWMIGSTSDYTTATWIGYDKYVGDNAPYLSNDKYLLNIQGKVTNLLLDKTVETFGTPEKVNKPAGVTQIEHILGTFPYATIIDGMNESLITKGYIDIDDVNLVDARSNLKIDEFPNRGFDVSIGSNDKITVDWPEYKDSDKFKVAEETMDISLKDSSGNILKEATGRRLFDYSWIFGPLQYKVDIIDEYGDLLETVSSDKPHDTLDLTIDLDYGDTVEACGYYGYGENDIDQNSNKVCQKISVDSSIWDDDEEDDDITINITGPRSASVNESVEYIASTDLDDEDSYYYSWTISGSGVNESFKETNHIGYNFNEQGTYTITCYYDDGYYSSSESIKILITN